MLALLRKASPCQPKCGASPCPLLTVLSVCSFISFVLMMVLTLNVRTIISTKLMRSEEHTSELQSHSDLVCRLLLEKKKKMKKTQSFYIICNIEISYERSEA